MGTQISSYFSIWRDDVWMRPTGDTEWGQALSQKRCKLVPSNLSGDWGSRHVATYSAILSIFKTCKWLLIQSHRIFPGSHPASLWERPRQGWRGGALGQPVALPQEWGAQREYSTLTPRTLLCGWVQMPVGCPSDEGDHRLIWWGTVRWETWPLTASPELTWSAWLSLITAWLMETLMQSIV